jgi:glycolate oxidase iron-sulfur subunit
MTALAHAEPRLRQAWREAESHCIKCGFCLPVCPTYRETGVESASPRGRLDLMYAVARGELSVEDIEEALALCLGCLACQSACPSGIRFGDMLEAERIDAARGHPPSRLRRFLLGPLLDKPAWLRQIARMLALYQWSGLQWLLRASRLLALAPPLARLERRMPPLSWPRGWRRRARAWGFAGAAGGESRVAGLLTGCVMDAVFGEAHLATVQVLRHHGWRTVAPFGQGCCGALARHAGEEELARSMARRTIAGFETMGDAPVVVNSAGCGAAMKEYGAWLDSDSAWRDRAAAFSRRVVDVCEFLTRIGLQPPMRPVPLRVAYHDPCHLLHAQGIRQQPRALLAQIPALELVELPEADWCCGGAGSYTLTQPAMSARVLERKMNRIEAERVEGVATGNPGCLLQIATGARARGLKLRLWHPVELLAMSYDDRAPQARAAAPGGEKGGPA